MSELRQNRITGEWVIVATERAKRPEGFHQKDKKKQLPSYDAKCPFCPGNESKTPAEILAHRALKTKPNTQGWDVRIVPNKFPALTPERDADWFQEVNFFNGVHGFGYHEVIIETPLHNKTIATLSQPKVEKIFFSYYERFLQIITDEKIRLVIVFRNQGIKAGASLEHPHSQVLGMPIIPTRTQLRLKVAEEYYRTHCRCITCDMIESTLKVKERVVLDTERFVVFQPFASQSPFETWIAPKNHSASFGDISIDELVELSHVTRDILWRMYDALGCPDYNYLIQTSPVNIKDDRVHHWYLQILPRVVKTVGFELSSGLYITIAKPEETADFLRKVPPPKKFL